MTQELNDTGKRNSEQNGVLAILRLVLGAGVTPAQGSVKPTEGFHIKLSVLRNADRHALFLTLPERIHRVQTRIRRTLPFISARTSCRLGFHRRLVLLLA